MVSKSDSSPVIRLLSEERIDRSHRSDFPIQPSHQCFRVRAKTPPLQRHMLPFFISLSFLFPRAKMERYNRIGFLLLFLWEGETRFYSRPTRSSTSLPVTTKCGNKQRSERRKEKKLLSRQTSAVMRDEVCFPSFLRCPRGLTDDRISLLRWENNYQFHKRE